MKPHIVAPGRMLFYPFILILLLLMAWPATLITAQTDRFTDVETGTQYRVERYVTANFPTGMAFAPDGRLFYNEKTTGNVRVVKADGTPQLKPVMNFPTDALQERGLLGISLDPNYAENHFIWVVHTAPGTTRDYPANQLVRFREDNGIGSDPEIMFSAPITTGQLLHNGGNVHFDADGHLYLSLGDFGDAAYAQDLSVPQGKVHRFDVTEDGLQPAPDNPFGADNSILAYGFRNPYDFTFDPQTGNLFTVENGPDCDDEVNLVLPRFNYGWRDDYECAGTDFINGLQLYAPPLLSFTPTIGPAGIVIYDGEAFPAWQGDLFFCGWNFGELQRAELNNQRTAVDQLSVVDLGGVPCRIDLAIGPDSAIYFGMVDQGDGAIYRIVPAEE